MWPELSRQDWQIIGWIGLCGSVCGAACAMLGCYLVLRRLSLLGDAISHAILPGVALGYLASGQVGGWPILLGALVVGFLTTFFIQSLRSFGQVPEDAGMGAVFTSLFALGVILISTLARYTDLDVDCVLYGQVEYAGFDKTPLPLLGWKVPRMLGTLFPALVMTVLFVVLLWKELKLSSFDPMLATSMGINATLIHYLLMGMVAMVTVASLEAVGSVLVVAMLIVPAATAYLLTDRLSWMMGLAVGLSTVAAFGGSYEATIWQTNTAGMIAVVGGVLFFAAVLLSPRYGLISQAYHNVALSLRIAGEDVLAFLYRRYEKSQGRIDQESLSWDQCCQAAGGKVRGWLTAARLRLIGQLSRGADGQYHLTESGRQYAETLVRTHRLWESFLVEHFQLPLDHLHEPASRIEHYIGPHLQEELSAELNRPERDPHGKPIPPGRVAKGEDIPPMVEKAN